MIGDENLSIIAYCDDLVILSPSVEHAKIILKECETYSKIWKIEFNSNKSSSITFCKKYKNENVFFLDNKKIPNVKGLIYLGLPIGNQEYVNIYCDNKMSKVEKSLYSLYGLGCKPKMIHPQLVSFIYKQFCQSIFRFHLDNVFINQTKLKELDVRQNILIKRTIGISKYCKTSLLNEALNVESIQQIYCKHKIFFIEQLRNNNLCYKIFKHINDRNLESTKSRSNSFSNQLKFVQNKIHINCIDYNKKTSINLIDFVFKENNKGAVDSVCFYFHLIKTNMERKIDYFYIYFELNRLLNINSIT